MTEQLDRDEAFIGREIELDVLGKSRQVGDNQHAVVFQLADKSQDLGVVGKEQFKRAATEGRMLMAKSHKPLNPPPKRLRIVSLRFDIDRFVHVFRVDDYRQVQTLWIAQRESGIAVG